MVICLFYITESSAGACAVVWVQMAKIKLIGNIAVPGDKAVSHRSLIFAGFCKGISRINNLSPAEDCSSTINCLTKLGLRIVSENNAVSIEAKGINQFVAPQETLFANNSGTTMRMLAGLVAGRPFTSHLDGDESLRRRANGANIGALKNNGSSHHLC